MAMAVPGVPGFGRGGPGFRGAGGERKQGKAREKTRALTALARLPSPSHPHQSDVIDIVHVAKIMAPESTVFHGVPGTSYSYHDEPLKDVQAHLTTVREWLAAEVVPLLAGAGARHEVHLFVDRTTAPAADVAATITCVADSVDAPLIVMVRDRRERESAPRPHPLVLLTPPLPLSLSLLVTGQVQQDDAGQGVCRLGRGQGVQVHGAQRGAGGLKREGVRRARLAGHGGEAGAWMKKKARKCCATVSRKCCATVSRLCDTRRAGERRGRGRAHTHTHTHT